MTPLPYIFVFYAIIRQKQGTFEVLSELPVPFMGGKKTPGGWFFGLIGLDRTRDLFGWPTRGSLEECQESTYYLFALLSGKDSSARSKKGSRCLSMLRNDSSWKCLLKHFLFHKVSVS